MSEDGSIFVYDGAQPQRLDKFLVTALPEFSRSRLQAFIKNGFVWVDDHLAGKSGQLLEPGTEVRIEVPAPEPYELTPEAIPLDIVFENSDLIVINKPAGMVVHPAAGHRTGTLVHAVLAHAPELAGVGGKVRPGVVHRLDKDTSGLIVLAKNDRAHQHLQEQFRLRAVNKLYLALVDGKPPTPVGRIEAAIGRHGKDRTLMAVVPDDQGRTATTTYHTREEFSNHTLLEASPTTGRTHQIRVHLAFIGCPVAGDRVYGYKKASIQLDRHFLHAAQLEICLPGETDRRRFEASLAPELVQVLESLRQSRQTQSGRASWK